MRSGKLKHAIILITYAVFLLFVIMNFSTVWNILSVILSVLMPFVVGFIVAFLVNLPYLYFSEKVFIGMSKRGKIAQKMRKPLALVLAYLIIFGVIGFLIGILVPEIIDSVDKLITNFSIYSESFRKWLTDFMDRWFNIHLNNNSDIFVFVNDIFSRLTGSELKNWLSEMSSSLMPSVFDVTKNVTTTIINLFMGVFISCYFMGCKEKLLYQSKKFIVAYIPDKIGNKIFEIGDLSNKIFGKYVYGKIIDSIIIGILCFIGMSIFGFDYAVLMSVIVAITNLVPVFGPIVGAVVTIFIMLMINPIEAIWFAIFLLVLQQLDGNFIGPKILGNSIGISGFWIMASVIIGSGLFGFWGMLLAVPIFSTLYVLLSRHVNSRIVTIGKKDMVGKAPEGDIIKQQMPRDPRENPYSANEQGYVFNNEFIKSIKTKVKSEIKRGDHEASESHDAKNNSKHSDDGKSTEE